MAKLDFSLPIEIVVSAEVPEDGIYLASGLKFEPNPEGPDTPPAFEVRTEGERVELISRGRVRFTGAAKVKL